jgi:hypothetical protein
MEEAMKAATSPNDFKLSVAAGGASTNGMEKVMEAAKADHEAAKEAAAEEEANAGRPAEPGSNAMPPDQNHKPVAPLNPEELAAKIAARQQSAGGQPDAPQPGAPTIGQPPVAQPQQAGSNGNG